MNSYLRTQCKYMQLMSYTYSFVNLYTKYVNLHLSIVLINFIILNSYETIFNGLTLF